MYTDDLTKRVIRTLPTLEAVEEFVGRTVGVDVPGIRENSHTDVGNAQIQVVATGSGDFRVDIEAQ